MKDVLKIFADKTEMNKAMFSDAKRIGEMVTLDEGRAVIEVADIRYTYKTSVELMRIPKTLMIDKAYYMQGAHRVPIKVKEKVRERIRLTEEFKRF